jgi:hypothetical protein
VLKMPLTLIASPEMHLKPHALLAINCAGKKSVIAQPPGAWQCKAWTLALLTTNVWIDL